MWKLVKVKFSFVQGKNVAFKRLRNFGAAAPYLKQVESNQASISAEKNVRQATLCFKKFCDDICKRTVTGGRTKAGKPHAQSSEVTALVRQLCLNQEHGLSFPLCRSEAKTPHYRWSFAILLRQAKNITVNIDSRPRKTIDPSRVTDR